MIPYTTEVQSQLAELSVKIYQLPGTLGRPPLSVDTHAIDHRILWQLCHLSHDRIVLDRRPIFPVRSYLQYKNKALVVMKV